MLGQFFYASIKFLGRDIANEDGRQLIVQVKNIRSKVPITANDEPLQ